MQGILLGLAAGLGILFQALQILVFVDWILWLVAADPGNGLVRFVRSIVQPPLAWLRRRLPFLVLGAWDLSALALILILIFLDHALAGGLRLYATRL